MEVEIKIEVSEEDDAAEAEECPVCGGDMQDGTCEDCGYDGATDVQAYSTNRRIAAVEEAIVTLARSRFFDGKYANETLDNQLQHTARVQQKAVRQKAEELRTQLQTTS